MDFTRRYLLASAASFTSLGLMPKIVIGSPALEDQEVSAYPNNLISQAAPGPPNARLAETPYPTISACRYRAEIRSSEQLAALVSRYSTQRDEFVIKIVAATSWYDPQGRARSLAEADKGFFEAVSAVAAMVRFLRNASADDKQWTREWAGTEISSLEEHRRGFQFGFESGYSDLATRSVFGRAIERLGSLLSVLNAVATSAAC